MVKLVNAGARGIEPHGAGFGLAELSAVGVGDERESEAVNGFGKFTAREVDSGGDVAPLIAAADLQVAVVRLFEVKEIERLQKHIRKFGVTDADVAVFHAGADAFFGDHCVDGEMLADVAQEIEQRDGVRPVGIVEQLGGVFGGLKIEELGELHLHRGDVGGEQFGRKQIALGGFATRIANGTGGPAGERDGNVAEILKTPQRNQRHEVADVQAVGGGIETAIEHSRPFAEARG